MNREMGLFEALASDGTYNVCVIVRGELAIGRISSRRTVKGGIVNGAIRGLANFTRSHCAVERHGCPTLGRRGAVKPRSRAAVRRRRRA